VVAPRRRFERWRERDLRFFLLAQRATDHAAELSRTFVW
jgi:hypothetical protein